MFNPWIILAALVASGLFGWYEYHAGYKAAMAENAAQVAKANEQSRQTEQKLATTVVSHATKLKKAQKNADQRTAKLKLDIGNGSLRLSIPTQSCLHATADSTATSGNSGEGRAELDRQTAENLIAIAADGDAAIRKHAACVDAYNEIREKLNANP